MILRKPACLRVSFFGYVFMACLGCFCSFPALSQGLSGTITEAFSHHPVPNATLTLSLDDTTAYNMVSDSLGRFTIKTERPGRYLLEVSAEGYLPTLHADIILDGYSTKLVEVALEKTSWELPAVVVSTIPRRTSPYIRTISADDMLQIAGNYDDPVRAALSDPGMVALNDQANHFSARGKSPVFNTWQLEGLDIVNPNHTSNAGTFSDLPTQYGGGVNMFSAQTLRSTDLYLGINPMQVNNISGATTNMHLHESATPEWRAKAGLLGFELGGGAAIGSNSIIDFNLRYSFTGLLTALGADFGGERISYYDGIVSFRNHGPKHTFKAFAWYGYSENLFDHPTDSAEIEEYKDFFDIDYTNTIAGTGATYTSVIGDKTNLHIGAALSNNGSTYDRTGTFETQMDSIREDVGITIFSSFAEFSIRHSARFKTLAGLNYRNRSFKTDGINSYPYLPFPEESMIRPYVNFTLDLSRSLRADAGADVSRSFIHSSLNPGYRASLRWNYNETGSLFAGLRHGAGEQVIKYSGDKQPEYVINSFYEAGWNLAGSKHSFTIDAYAHKMKGLLRQDLNNGFIHMADYPYTFSISPPSGFTTDAEAFYYGLEGQWEYKHSGWRIFVNQSMYHSERDTKAESNGDGRYNGQYATHAVIAREIIREKKGKSRIWNFGLRGLWHGGLWEQQIDQAASEQFYTTLYSNSGVFDRRIPDYRRLDLTLVRTIGDKKIRWRYALDIQNVLGLTNVAYTYYDPYLNKISDQEQLGLIPVLSVQASW